MKLQAKKGNLIIKKGSYYDIDIMKRADTGEIYFLCIIPDNDFISSWDLDVDCLEWYFGKLERI